ncbi:sulfatase-like hydrolase/transferase [Nocardioides sp.]|uniref:sulfatase-like hydrolase/transferase n=1 Tax=Nocardioides sp. TaxID=35761 RepID=UPI00378302D8
MITRRRLLASAAAAPPAVALAASAGQPGYGVAPAVAGKNILIFINDQQRATQHFPRGWEEENLPGLTRLKKHGVSFENAFTNACMCSPSRATMFTGLYPAQHGVKYTLEEDMPADQYPQVELSTDLTNLASVMSAAGYEVVYKGKWHCSKPEGEDWAPSDLAAYGFSRWDPPDSGGNQDLSEAGGGTVDHDGHYMHDQGDAAAGEEGVIQFLRRREGATKPWCLVVGLVNPHDVLFYPGPRKMDPPKWQQAGYTQADLEGDIGLPPTVLEDLRTKPDAQAQFARLYGAGGKPLTRKQKLEYINFYGNLMKVVDGYLVEILDTLAETHQLRDTVVIRTSDHGEMGLAHRMQQKNFNFYEESTRIPLVFSNPELFRRPRRSRELVSHLDLLPTLATLVDAPDDVRSDDWRGVDYSGLVLGTKRRAVQKDIVFTYDDWQAGQSSGPYIRPPNHIVAVREKRWKVAKYYDTAGIEPAQWEMYDLAKDPLERHNLAYKPKRMTKVQRSNFRRLKKRIKQAEKTDLLPLAHGAGRAGEERQPLPS